MTSAETPLALVMGNIDLVRPLGLARIPCAVFGPPDNPVRFSRHVRESLPWVDPWTRSDALADALLTFATRQPTPPVLLPQNDADLLVASRLRRRLAPHLRLALADEALVEALVDKARFQALGEELELPLPPARRVRAAEDHPQELGLRFPLVIKPVTRHEDLWRPIEPRAKALRVADASALAQLWPRLAARDLQVLAQEEVPGDETRIVSYHVYVDERGAVAGEFTGRKIRTLPARYGHSTAVEITVEHDVAALGREIVERLDLRGVAKVDFKRSPEGVLYLLEINPRFNLWHHPGARAGVNLPALVYADLTGRPRPAARRLRPGVTWCAPRLDYRAARVAGLTTGHWLRWLVRCEAASIFAWDDPLPVLAAIGSPLRRRLARLVGSMT
jgi:predicted ATP-grasp superfamily ATP-dependent carboligase